MADSSINIKIGADSKKAVDELEKISAQFSSMKKIATAVGGAILAAFAFDKLVDGFNAVVGAAEESEKAVTQLNLALKLAGSFSTAASLDFQHLAEEIQNTTTFTDEAVLSSVALAKQFNATNDEAKRMVVAATDLAAATGVDLNTATRQLGQTLDGTAGRIAEHIPQLRGLTAEQLKSGAAIGIVADRYRGFAAAMGNTFSGAIIKAKNSFDDLLETIGNFIIKNPIVIQGIQFITDQFKLLKKFINQNQDAILEFTKDGIINLIEFGREFIRVLRNIDEPISRFIDKLADIFNFVKRLGEIGRAVKLSVLTGSTKPLELLNADMERDAQERIANTNENLKVRASIYDTLFEKLSGLKEQTEAIDSEILTSDPTEGVGQGTAVKRGERTAAEKEKEAISAASGFVGNLKQGAEGAAGAITSAVGMVADFLLPGLGSLVTQIFDFLAQGPDVVAAQIQAFVDAIPKVVENIILAIPVVIRAFIEKLPELINALLARIPFIVQAVIKEIPSIISAFIQSFIPQTPFMAMQITIEIIKNIPHIIAEFAKEFMKIPEQFARALISAIGDIGNIFGFAQGGVVGAAAGFGVIQGGYPGKDTVPVLAQAGELLVPKSNFNEVIEAVSAARMASSQQSSASGNGGGFSNGGLMNVIIGFEGNEAERVLTARQVEARSLGTLREA